MSSGVRAGIIAAAATDTADGLAGRSRNASGPASPSPLTQGPGFGSFT